MGHSRYPRVFLDVALYLLAYCLVNFQPSFLVGGFSKLLASLVLAYLLAFVVIHPTDAFKRVAACLEALPVALAPLVVERQWIEESNASFAVPNKPSLAPLFQRPPPIFSL